MLRSITTAVAFILSISTASAQSKPSEIMIPNPAVSLVEVLQVAAEAVRAAQLLTESNGEECLTVADAEAAFLAAAGTEAQVEAGNTLASARAACVTINVASTMSVTVIEQAETTFEAAVSRAVRPLVTRINELESQLEDTLTANQNEQTVAIDDIHIRLEAMEVLSDRVAAYCVVNSTVTLCRAAN